MDKTKYRIERVSKEICKTFLLKHHYLSRQGYGFRSGFNYGLFEEDVLIGVAVFHGVSAGETVVGCFGLAKNDQAGFYELGRLAMDPDYKVKNLTSWFLSKAMKQFRKDAKPRAIISYADATYHHGYIYQACNYTYHGLTTSNRITGLNKLMEATKRQVEAVKAKENGASVHVNIAT